MTHEKFLVAGVARNIKGQLRVRYSTLTISDTVIRQQKAGNTDILYVELPTAMVREDIPAYLLTLAEFTAVPAYKTCLEDANTGQVLKNKPARVPTGKVSAPKAKTKPVKAPKVQLPKPDQADDLLIEELKILATA